MHAEWTIKAVQAEKYVICEKPIALTIAEADAIDSAEDTYGKVVTEAFMFCPHPQTLKARDIVLNGKLGTLKWCEVPSLLCRENRMIIDGNPKGGVAVCGTWDAIN